MEQPIKRSEDSLMMKALDDTASKAMLEFFENLILERFVSLEKSMTLQIGCSTPGFSASLMEKVGPWGRLIIIEPSKFLLESTRVHLGAKAAGRVFFKSDMSWTRLPFDDGVFQSVVSVLFWDRSPNRFRVFQEMSRVLVPSGMALLIAYLKDSAREFFDLFSEVLTQFDMPHLAQPLQTVRNTLLMKNDYQVLAEECGFGVTKVHEHPFTLAFANSKDLFACPLVHSHWLPLWDKIAGKESERIFWHIRQSLDRYFAGRKVPLTIQGGLIVGIK